MRVTEGAWFTDHHLSQPETRTTKDDQIDLLFQRNPVVSDLLAQLMLGIFLKLHDVCVANYMADNSRMKSLLRSQSWSQRTEGGDQKVEMTDAD